MFKSANEDVAAIRVNEVEGTPTYGGDLLVKPLLKGDEMTVLEIHYAAGVGTRLHSHAHESVVYLLKGKMRSIVGSQEFTLGPGDACRHPKGVMHGMEAIEDSLIVEVKSPPPELASFFANRTDG